MKCKKCGGNIGIDEIRCPYCGEENPFAMQHEQNMEQYKERFDETGEEVVDSAKETERMAKKGGIIVVLIVVIIIMTIVASFNYVDIDDRDDIKKEAKMDPDDHIAEIDAFLEKGEYMECVSYMYANDIMSAGADEYHDLRGVKYVASDYYECMKLMEKMIYRSDDEDYFDNLDTYIRSFSMHINSFYETYEVWIDSKGSEKYRAYMEDMEYELKAAMSVYFKMNDEELNEFLSLSEANKAVRLEEVFDNGYE